MAIAGSGDGGGKRWLSEREIEMLVLIGALALETEPRLTYPDDTSRVEHNGGEISSTREQKAIQEESIPVPCLPVTVLQDGRLIADALIPNFLAGMEISQQEDGRENGRMVRCHSSLFRE
jgi:hypothetical protein